MLEIPFIERDQAEVNSKLRLEKLYHHEEDEQQASHSGELEMKPRVPDSVTYEVYLGLFQLGASYQPFFRDFEVLEMIGEGSFGRVFKARHRDSGILMAMKAMKKQFLVQN